jgi:hypothetical protein
MRIPSIITAGDTVVWQDYGFVDAQGGSVDSQYYSLAYNFRGPASVLDLTGVAQGTGWLFTMSATQSAALNLGTSRALWFWQASATKAAVRVTAGDGTLNVKPNLAAITTAGFDGASKAEQILKAIDTEIQARINGGATVEYTIGTRSLKKEAMSELLKLRSMYNTIVARERRGQMIKNGLGNPSRVGVRFR